MPEEHSNGGVSFIDKTACRVILFHKHPISARLSFFRYSHNSICGFSRIPKLAALIESAHDGVGIRLHPEVVAKWVANKLGINKDNLQVAAEFFAQLEVPKGIVDVYLVGLKGYEAVAIDYGEYQGQFVSLMDCVGVAPVEMLLAQRAYKVIMGGQ